jgi:hypothetical protein
VQGAFFRTHPRFFVSCLGLGRAVKPKRLLLPARVPAVSAGLRVLRDEGRVSGRASLRGPLAVREVLLLALPVTLGLPAAGLAPLLWPFRWPQAGVEGLAVREPEAPLAGREALPLLRAPFAELFVRAPFVCAPFVWVPLCLPLAVAGALAVHLPAAGRAPLVASGRAAESVRCGAPGARLRDCRRRIAPACDRASAPRDG